MYKLYYAPGACSLAIHALLISLDVPFELVSVDSLKEANRNPDYLKLNPRGQVPVLVVNDRVLRESAVMATYLADKYHSPLLPTEEFGRYTALEWLGFYNSSLHQAYGAYFLLSKSMKDENAKYLACDLVVRRINYLWREVESTLADKQYLAGNRITLPDLFHAVIANWTTVLNHKVTLGPNIIRLGREISCLPYFQQALKTEGIKYSLVGE